MKTLYIHIGTPKTGTTALQMFCWQNMEALESYGYCYPDMKEIFPEWRKTRNGYFVLHASKNSKEKTPENVVGEKYRKGMETIVSKFEEYDNIILSEERIFHATDGKGNAIWKELKTDSEKYGFEIKIVVYLRRQDEFVASLWKQNISHRIKDTSVDVHTKNWEEFVYTKKWEDFIATAKRWKRLNYYKKLESIAAVFGRENIIVRRYDRERFLGNSIYADFLDAIGLEMKEDFVIKEEERNPSLYGNTCEMMRILNGTSALNEDDRIYMRNLMLIDAENGKDVNPTSMFSQEECREFLEYFRESNRRVAKEYLGEEDTDLFTDKVPDLPKWTADNPFMYQDIIRVMAFGFKQLQEENKSAEIEIKMLKEEIKLLKERNKIFRGVQAIGRRLSK